MNGEAVRIFISSPADVAYERDRVEQVARRLSGMFDGLDIQCYRWEKGWYFSAHETFQAQIPPVGEHDLLIGILWSRLGSALPEGFPRLPDGERYPSGTAFEILSAMACRRGGGEKPDVLVYRKTQSPPVSAVNSNDRHALTAQLDALDAFIARWFVNPTDGFKSAFHDFQTTDEFEALVQEHLQAWLKEHRVIGRDRRWRVEHQGSPFRGLEAFDRSHRDVFFGRRPEIERARELLEQAAGKGCAFLLIEGASGTGKSSLARAGLLPRLQDLEPNRRIVVMRPGDRKRPLDALSAEVFRAGAIPELTAGDFPNETALSGHFAAGGGAQPLLRALERAAAARRRTEGRELDPSVELVLLVDQLEQLFTRDVEPADRARFATILSELARSGRASVIATLRADAHAAALEEPALLGLFDAGAVLRLSPPGEAALTAIIQGPVEAAWLAFERRKGHGLDEALVADTTGANVLPLLQFALERLYEAAMQRLRAGGRTVADQVRDGLPVVTLTFDDYRALGAIDGAIDHQAEYAFADLRRESREALPRLIRTLSTAGEGEPVALTVPEPAVATDDSSQALVDALVEARILIRDGTAIRFAHERVLTAWKRAADMAQRAERFHRVRDSITRAMARWASEGRKTDLLLPSGVMLAEAEEVMRDYGEELRDLREFVAASSRRARRRQRVLALVAATFAGVAAAAVVASLVALDARDQADRNFEAANRNFETGRRVATAVVLDVVQRLRTIPGMTYEHMQALQQTASESLDALLESDPRNQDVRYTRALLLDETAKTALSANDRPAAERYSAEARAILEGLLKEDPNNTDWLRDLGIALMRTGDVRREQGASGEATGLYQQALDIQRDLRDREPANAEWARDVATTLYRIGDVEFEADEPGKAGERYRQAEQIARELVGGDAGDAESAKLLSVILTKIGATKRREGDTDAAVEAFQEAADILEGFAARSRGNTDLSHDLAMTLHELGRAERRDGNAERARLAQQNSLRIMRRLAAQDRENTRWAHSLAILLTDEGRRQLRSDGPEAALATLSDAVAIMRRLLEIDPANLTWVRAFATALGRIGDVRMVSQGIDEALMSYQEAVDRLAPLMAGNPEESWIARDLGALQGKIADILMAGKDTAGALRTYSEAQRLLQKAVKQSPGQLGWQRDLAANAGGLARAQMLAGDRPGAIATYRHAVEAQQRLVDERPHNRNWLRILGTLLIDSGDLDAADDRPADAELSYGRALEVQRRLVELSPGDADLQVGIAYTLFKRSLVRDHPARAADLLEADTMLGKLAASGDLTTGGRQVQAVVRAQIEMLAGQ